MKSIKANSLVVAAFSIIIIFGGIFIANSLGLWETESKKEPMKIKSGEFEGQPNPEDIRGSYSFADVENAFGLEAKLIAEAFGIETDDPGAVKAKDLEGIYGDLGEDVEIGTGSVKIFVSIYTGLPYEGHDYLPKSAVEVLKAADKWTVEAEASMEGYILDLSTPGEFTPLDTEKEAEDESEHEEEIAIKGKTTVADAISYGISLEEVEEVLGLKVENTNMLIRDLCAQNDLSFSEIKEQLNAKID